MFLLPPGPFLVFENRFLSSRPIKKSSDKKDMKTKVIHLDEIYLEYGLRFELKPQIQPPEAKNYYLVYSKLLNLEHLYACNRMPSCMPPCMPMNMLGGEKYHLMCQLTYSSEKMQKINHLASY